LQQLPKLSSNTIKTLKKGKNLLAYSAGSDSNALFFILQAYGIEFDLAIVNYKTRDKSDEEESYAKELAKRFGKICYSFTCKLQESNFEHNARVERYKFFSKTIKENSYTTLLTAHHLNDKLEWFLMQLSKGSGLNEMFGMSETEERENYKIVRPLLHVSKDEILEFLKTNEIFYFQDSSNFDEKYLRNKLRFKFANPFIKEYKNGVKKSFEYLAKDVSELRDFKIKKIKELYIIQKDSSDLKNIRAIDKVLKELGVLLTSKSREEILRTENCVISHKIAVIFNDDLIFVAPYIKTVMPKSFKEECRKKKIPPKIRGYIYQSNLLDYFSDFSL